MTHSPTHAVAVIGGATAGAEVAARLAERGVEVTVFDMNPRPYGKIEDGLPRWHRALRKKEYESISGRLSKPNVHFVPLTKIGRDVSFRELAESWGFSAVVLACGAWRDRPVPIEGADAFVGKGLIYQNPFIISFNHASEPDFKGTRHVPQDGAIVLGGGLASIDVAKVLMLETTRKELEKRGHHVDVEELEKKGIPATLEQLGITWDSLGLKGCTLFYRRRPEDMPLMEIPEEVPPERIAKIEQSRKHILTKAMEKFSFKFEPLSMPEALIVEDDRLVGLKFRRAKVEGKKLLPTDETFERRGSCVISSIGSIPEPMPGVQMKGELFPFTDWVLGRMAEFPRVFSAGNVVTGKGNIIASRKHASKVAEDLVGKYLGLNGHEGEEKLLEGVRAEVSEAAAKLAEQITHLPRIDPRALEGVRSRVRERQQAVGYPGDYASWIARVTPLGFE
jgi:ferredoxin/flavodoxin---NADP+ reductase